MIGLMNNKMGKGCQGILLLSALGLLACKPIKDVETAGYIIGENDIEVIKTKESDIKESILQASVVLTTEVDKNNRKFCSGTLVEGDQGTMRILTNHHCFVNDQNEGNSAELMAGHCKSTVVYFNFYQDRKDQRIIRGCAFGSFRSFKEWDLAVFALDRNPPENFAPAPLGTDEDVKPGDEAMIVHFPFVDKADPLYLEKTFLEPTSEIRIPYAQVTDKNCVIEGYFPKDQWSLDPTLPFSKKHTCDQKKGSSGSALWHKATGKVTGVNWGGIKLSYENRLERDIHNVATRMKVVKAFLNNETIESEVLEQDAPPSGVVETEAKSESMLSCGIVGLGSESQVALLFLIGLWPLAIRRKKT